MSRLAGSGEKFGEKKIKKRLKNITGNIIKIIDKNHKEEILKMIKRFIIKIYEFIADFFII